MFIVGCEIIIIIAYLYIIKLHQIIKNELMEIIYFSHVEGEKIGKKEIEETIKTLIGHLESNKESLLIIVYIYLLLSDHT